MSMEQFGIEFEIQGGKIYILNIKYIFLIYIINILYYINILIIYITLNIYKINIYMHAMQYWFFLLLSNSNTHESVISEMTCVLL